MQINDLWQSFLEDKPESAYFGYQNQQRSPNQQKYFQNQFSNVQNQYLGKLGQQIMGGGAPSLSFTDYLQQYFAPQGGAAQQWGSMSPGQRGMNTQQFAPRTRWML